MIISWSLPGSWEYLSTALLASWDESDGTERNVQVANANVLPPTSLLFIAVYIAAQVCVTYQASKASGCCLTG